MPKRETTAVEITGYFIVLASVIIFVHGAMGVTQYKHWLSLHDEQNTTLPLDVILECLVALGVAIFGIMFFVTRPFKPIINASETKLKMMDGLTYSEDFAMFRRRRHPVPLFNKRDS